MKKYSSIGELLIDYRILSNTSQIALASQFDVDIRTIQRWEKNMTLLKPDKEEAMVDVTFIPYQVIRNLNAPVSIPTFYDFELRKYSLSTIANELPDADWMKSKMDYATDRLRTIGHDSDVHDIIRCTMVHKHLSKSIRKELIVKAVELLPELNAILFDGSGYYAGHMVFFPISQTCYRKIRNRSMKEEELTELDFIEYRKVDNPVFYAYDVGTDCNENMFYIAGSVMRFFKEIQNKNYLYASYTSRDDTYTLNKNIGTTLVWEDKIKQKEVKSKAPPRLYEGNFEKFLNA
ncbi:MAG: transcriptional regulator with XRE-family HTH domain [Maribacter sp.]|jgi:transcriptional regulator with XRE-family HTH domain|tara:strand:+ start:167 stop:1039 length:873 start_codon:yes stop_codon:yes gene_type:complete